MTDGNAKMVVENNSTRRIVFMVVFWLLMFLVHAFVYLAFVRVYEIELPYATLILALLSFYFIFANIINRKYDGRWVDWLYFDAASWLGIIFLAFSFTALYEIIGLFIPGESKILYNIAALGTVLSSVYGLFNGARVIVKEIEIPIHGLEKEIKIVQLSDVHIGTIHQEKFLERIVKMSNDLEPDLVLMTGDLFDGSEPIHEEMLRPLNDLRVPTYFSMGNHEEYEGLQYVRETINNLDMQLLDSEVVEAKGLQIIGVNDRQSIPKEIMLDDILAKLVYDRSKPTVLMYHTPVEWSAARKHGIDLMLSGHTHNGQIYPFNWIVRTSFKYINGLYEEEGKFLHVSPGTGTWGPPMRLGSRNQVSLLRLVATRH